jgi:hypothetical protein
MSISASPASSSKSFWSNAEDNRLRRAIWYYNIDHPTAPFPEDHFDMRFEFSNFIKKYLPNLSKDSKQVRERCITHIISKARSNILLQDQEKALSLYREYLQEGETRIWMRMSRFFYEKNDKAFYYSANSLKNFVYRRFKSLERKENKSAEEAPPSQKKRRIEPTSSSSACTYQSLRPVSAPPVATRQHSLTLDGALTGTGIPVLGDLEEAALRNTPLPIGDNTGYPEESTQCAIPSHSPVNERWLFTLDDDQQAALENEVFLDP